MTKSNKGMKEHKKVQKKKAIAKGAAAAKNSKQSKTVKVEMKKMEVPDVTHTVDEVAIELSPTTKEVVAPVTPRHDELEGTSAEDATTVPLADSSADSCPRIGSMIFDQHIVGRQPSGSFQPISSTACTSATSDDIDNAISTEAFDIHAHRKALEAALYDAMESPMKRLARLANVKSASAEFYERDNDCDSNSPDLGLAEVADTPKHASDDNSFSRLPVTVELPAAAPRARSITIDELFSKVSERGTPFAGHSDAQVSYTLADIESQLARSISADQLFSKVSESNSSLLSHSKASVSYKLADVESQLTVMHGRAKSPTEKQIEKWTSIIVSQLFVAATLEQNLVVELPAAAGDEYCRRARKLTVIEAGIEFGCGDQISESKPLLDPAIVSFKVAEAHPLVDPAIVSYKINQTGADAKSIRSHSSGSWDNDLSPERSVYDDRPYTPATFYSTPRTPPPCDQYGNTLPYGPHDEPFVPDYSHRPSSQSFMPDESYARDVVHEQYWIQQGGLNQSYYRKMMHCGPYIGSNARAVHYRG